MSIWDVNYKEGIRSAWTANPIIQQVVNQRMTGQDKHWLNWFFEDHLKKKPKRLLSVGCGDGAHELIIAEKGYAESIDAFDASEVGIASAKAKAVEKGLRNINLFLSTFEQFIQSPPPSLYDLVMFSGSLHHVREIEAMLKTTKDILIRPHGVMVLNEYIGPCYNIYDERRLQIINDVLNSIAAEFKISPHTQLRSPTIETVYAADPTESVRSSLIMQFVDFYFDFRFKHYFGGALLHPIFDHLDSKRLSDGSAESQTIVNMLVTLEKMLIEAGSLPHDFCFAVCTPRD